MRRAVLFLAWLAALVLAPAPAMADWHHAATTHFNVYVEGSARHAQEIAERLERFDGVLRRLSPTPPRESPLKLTVFIPGDSDTVGLLTGNDRIAGYYIPTVAGSFLVAPRWRPGRFDATTVLFHEYTHHFMLANYSTVYPGWFVEGYAELLSNVQFDDDAGTVTIGRFADHRARELALPPPRLITLLFTLRREMRRQDFVAYYSNAWFLTHYLVLSGERQGQLGRYIALTGEGRVPEQAAAEAFGGVEGLQRDFLRYRGGRHIPTTIIRLDQMPPPGPIAVTAVPEAQARTMLLQVRYRSGVPRNDIASFARRVRARAGEAPDDPAVLQLLADTEYLAGDLPAATRAVDALLAARPNAPRALLRRGLIEIRLLEDGRITDPARWTAARDWIRRANLADTDDPLILLEYYRAFVRQRAGRPPRNAVAALARAFELVPQDFRLRGHHAEQLIGERQFFAAVGVLAPVAYSAHAGRLSEVAARRIEAIRNLPDGTGTPPPPPATAPAPAEERDED